MKATKNGWTVEGTPREIAELIEKVPARSLYETPEGKAPLKDFERMHITEEIRQAQAKINKLLEECGELDRRGKDEKNCNHL